MHPERDGKWNMAVDAMLVRTTGLPISVRFYSWQPPAMTLGHNQRFDEDLARRCHERGIKVVRRETGGRAVLHARELTYCVSIPVASPLYTRSLPEAYNRINRALVNGLTELGIPVELESRKIDLAAAYRKELGGICFAATAQSEVLYDGRKLIGSAQRQMRCGIMQHGSLILDRDHHLISELFFDDPEMQEKARKKLEASTSWLREAVDPLPDFRSMSEALTRGFEKEYEIELLEEELNPCEEARVKSILDCFDPRHAQVRVEADWICTEAECEP